MSNVVLLTLKTNNRVLLIFLKTSFHYFAQKKNVSTAQSKAYYIVLAFCSSGSLQKHCSQTITSKNYKWYIWKFEVLMEIKPKLFPYSKNCKLMNQVAKTCKTMA